MPLAGVIRTWRGRPNSVEIDPTATSAVHFGNGFDGGFSPLSNCSIVPLRCRLLSMGSDMQRREFITIVVSAAAAWPFAAIAQRPVMPVVGFMHTLSFENVPNYVAAFRQGLKEAGFVEGQNVAVEYRWAEGQYVRLPELAADLVRRKVAVIAATGGDPSPQIAEAATQLFLLCSPPMAIQSSRAW